MSISRRSLITGIATAAVVPTAQASAPGIITVRNELAGWPDWEPQKPGATFQITADSLQFLEPAPGYRFRLNGAIMIHEPVKST